MFSSLLINTSTPTEQTLATRDVITLAIEDSFFVLGLEVLNRDQIFSDANHKCTHKLRKISITPQFHC